MNVKGWILAVIALVMPIVMRAQAEVGDTVAIVVARPDSVVLTTAAVMPDVETPDYPEYYQTPFVFSAGLPMELNVADYAFSPGVAPIFTWNSGGVAAQGTKAMMPGLMRIDHGELGVNQQVGQFAFYAGAEVNKYGYFRGLHTQYGILGSIVYRLSPQAQVNVFGSYYFGRAPMVGSGMIMSPAMAGYFGVSNFGMTIDYSVNEHFGVEVGGQSVQQIGTQRYRAEPIVTPYFKAGKVKIGLPVGQIVYGILRSRVRR